MATEKSQLRIKRKNWYQVYTNSTFGETFIGELPLEMPDQMKGRHIQANLMSLTGNPKNQNINLKFRVEKVVGAKGIAYPVSYSIVSSSIRRIVRRKKDKLDYSFKCSSADGIKMKLKPMFVTKSQTRKSIHISLRKEALAFLEAVVTKSNYLTLFMDVINYKVQRALRDHLKKTYPLSIAELRVLETIPGQELSKASEETKRPSELLERKMPERPSPRQGQQDSGQARDVQPDQSSENSVETTETIQQ